MKIFFAVLILAISVSTSVFAASGERSDGRTIELNSGQWVRVDDTVVTCGSLSDNTQPGGCNVYGCWRDGGGCNVYGCWNSPHGRCNVYGCSDYGECTVYGCP